MLLRTCGWIQCIRTSFLRWQKWSSSVETAVKEMIESVCLPFITNSCLFSLGWWLFWAKTPLSLGIHCFIIAINVFSKVARFHQHSCQTKVYPVKKLYVFTWSLKICLRIFPNWLWMGCSYESHFSTWLTVPHHSGPSWKVEEQQSIQGL